MTLEILWARFSHSLKNRMAVDACYQVMDWVYVEETVVLWHLSSRRDIGLECGDKACLTKIY